MTEQTQDTAGVAEVDMGDTSVPAIEAVYTDAETRLFAVRGIICMFPPTAAFALDVENPVPLLDTDGRNIGSARVFIEDGVIMADGLFQYGCPERLSIETGMAHYFHPQMTQGFFHILPEQLEELRKLHGHEVQFSGPAQSSAAKLVPLVGIEVERVILNPDQRTDASIPPVVVLSEEESP